MVALIPVISTRMRFLVLASTFGPMAKSTMVSGRRIKCTAKACSNGKTANSTKVTSATTSVRAMAFSLGKTAVCTRASGKMENSTEKEYSSSPITQGD